MGKRSVRTAWKKWDGADQPRRSWLQAGLWLGLFAGAAASGRAQETPSPLVETPSKEPLQEPVGEGSQGAQQPPPADRPELGAGEQGPPAPAIPPASTSPDQPVGPESKPNDPTPIHTLLAAPPAAGSPAAGSPAGGANAPPPVRAVALQPAYRPLADVAVWVDRLASSSPALARAFHLATLADGRAVPAMEFGAPGDVPRERRPTVFLIGGLDGLSLEGGEAVLQVARDLLAAPERLPAHVTFVAVPWASPEALEEALLGRNFDGRNARAIDEDRDGLIDEDPPDDLDGDGLVLDMLIEDPRGDYARSSDARFLVRAQPGDHPRFHLVKEGRDDDGDNRFNEDAKGGVVLDLNFPVGRTAAIGDVRLGSYPLSEGVTRALADLALARPCSVALFFQGRHGGIAAPGGVELAGSQALVSSADREVYARVGELFAKVTGRAQTPFLELRAARGETRPGAALDWFHAALGALSVEISPWGPMVEGRPGVALRDARFERGQGGSVSGAGEVGLGMNSLASARPPGDWDRQWAQWLDNVHGGLGFSTWRPVELGPGMQGRRAFIGGWEPRTRFNPPDASLEQSVRGFDAFVLSLATAMPRLELRVVSLERRGEVVHVRAQVKNLGYLPAGLEGAATKAERGSKTLATGKQTHAAALELELASGADLIAGEQRVDLGRLAGQELSRDAAWVLFAPPGSVVTLKASAAWAVDVRQELRP